MVDTRTALAAVLGIMLGAFLVAAPDAVVRAHTIGRVPGDRGGEYGSDGTTSKGRRRLVQVLGVGSLALGLYLAWTLL